MTDQQAVTVTQADREAACETYLRFRYGQPPLYTNIAAGRIDHDPIVQHFARHRLASVSSASAEPRKDTVAFVQEWMMSGDHEPDQWHRDFAAAIDARRPTEQSIFDAINEDCGTDAAAWIIARLAAAATPTAEPVPATNQAGEVEVTQADREAAASLIAARPLADNVDIIRHAGADDGGFVQAFARHRIASSQQRFLTAQPANNQAKEGAQLRAAFVETMQPLFLLETAEKLADKFIAKVSL